MYNAYCPDLMISIHRLIAIVYGLVQCCSSEEFMTNTESTKIPVKSPILQVAEAWLPA